MPKIVVVWEMGADLGHVTRLDTLAKYLAGRGHEVVCIFSDVSEIQRLYPRPLTPSYRLLAGPSWPDKHLKLSRPPANLVEVLLSIGYYKPQVIAQKLADWRVIFAELKPDLIIYDYAPTAVLASRDLTCKKIGIDDPFSKPPDIFPLPSFDLNAKVSIANLKISEIRLVDTVNLALAQFQLGKITQASDLFATDKSFLLSIPELDPFSHLRASANYVGLISTSGSQQKIALNWNTQSSAKKVFVYLKPNYPKIKELLSCLVKFDIQGRFFIPQASQEMLDICRSANNVEISEQPYELAKNLAECDLIICHGGHSTLMQAALCAVPTLIIPLQQEQLSTAQKCVDGGLALAFGSALTDAGKIHSIIHTILSDESFKQRNQLCSDFYKNTFTRSALEIITQYIEFCL